MNFFFLLSFEIALLEAVNSLCQYASQPEFVSIPAKVSGDGKNAQEPILQAGRGVLDGVVGIVRAVKSLAVAPQNPTAWQQLSHHSKPVSESVKRLVDSIRDKAPGQAQCDSVLETINTCTRELDTASMTINVSIVAFTIEKIHIITNLSRYKLMQKQNTIFSND